MREFKFKGYENDGRPVFYSNGVGILMATGSDTQVTMLEKDVLEKTFDAELIIDKVTLNPYFQIGECEGSIYRLNHFPIDGADVDYKGLLVFNVVPTEEYKKACEDPNVICVGRICQGIVSGMLFDGWGYNGPEGEWALHLPEDVETIVENANMYLQGVIDQLNK